jgi:hypothetical protein
MNQYGCYEGIIVLELNNIIYGYGVAIKKTQHWNMFHI